MSTLVFRFEGDGHKPRVSPKGDLVGWGDTNLQVVHVPNPSAIWPIGQGRALRFLDNRRVTWVKPTSNRTADLYWADLMFFSGGLKDETVDPSLVGGNDFEAGDGHWASVLVDERRLTYDGQIRNVVSSAVRMCGEYMLTVETNLGSQYFNVYRKGNFERRYPLPSTANEFRISEQGWITFGYFGPTYVITPDGKTHQINVVKNESIARIVHLPDGEVWAWTSAVLEEGRPLVLGRPLAFLDGTDTLVTDDLCVQLPLAAEGVDAQWWAERQSFTVAGAANLGHTTPLEVHVVPVTHLRSKVESQAREPELDASGKKINLWDFIKPNPRYWPRTSQRANGHDMNMVFDGRNLWTIPFGEPGHWIRWIITKEGSEEVLRLREDHSKDNQNTGNWSATNGRVAKQFMAPRQFGGEVLDQSDNVLVRYGATSCDIVDIHRRAFIAYLYQHWNTYYCGVDLGWREVIVLAQEAGGEIELLWFASDGASYFRFQVIDAADHSRIKHETWFEAFGGPDVQPTSGCWKSEHLLLTPGEDDVQKPGITVVKYADVIEENVDTQIVHWKDRNNSGHEFKVSILDGSLKVEMTYDNWGTKSDYTNSPRPVTVKD